MADVSEEDFNRLFEDTLSTLRPLVEREDGAEPDEPIQGNGEALDGRVKVVAVPGGRLESVELDPRALREGSEALAEAFQEATNAALEDLQRALAQNLPDMVDQQALLQRLQEFQNEAATQMGKYLRAISEVQDRLERD